MAKTRVKDEHNEHVGHVEGLSTDMEAFLDKLYAVEGGKYKGIRITSGLRKANEGARFSHHHTGDAIDIAALGAGGDLGLDAYEYLMNTEPGLALLDEFGLGIIDETDPSIMEKTGASGPHFHIGKDTKFSQITKERLGQYHAGKLVGMSSFYAQNKGFDYNNPQKSFDDHVMDENDPKVPYTNFDLMTESPAFSFVNAVRREREKDEVKEKKTKQSADRKRLEKEMQKKMEAEAKKKREFIEMLSKINAPEPTKPVKQVQMQPLNFKPVMPMTSLPSLPSIHNIPGFQDGGVSGEEPKPKTAKQIRNEQYFSILHSLRGQYQHLDDDTERWLTPGQLNFGGKPIKGYDEKGFVPVTTKDYVTWKVSGMDFKPDPTKFIDTGITGVDKEAFEAKFKAEHPDIEEAEYNKQFESAWQKTYESDRVVLAPREHDKYGNLWVPIGTGPSSQKITEGFGKKFGDFYTKKTQIIPYYNLKDEEEYGLDYYNWRRAQDQLGEFEEGAVEQQKYGGLFKH